MKTVQKPVREKNLKRFKHTTSEIAREKENLFYFYEHFKVYESF